MVAPRQKLPPICLIQWNETTTGLRHRLIEYRFQGTTRVHFTTIDVETMLRIVHNNAVENAVFAGGFLQKMKPAEFSLGLITQFRTPGEKLWLLWWTRASSFHQKTGGVENCTNASKSTVCQGSLRDPKVNSANTFLYHQAYQQHLWCLCPVL